MEVIHRRVAGLDVHKKSISACIRMLDEAGHVEKTTRTFETMTDSIRMLSEWLSAQQVTHVAMESTGVYWKPIFNLLEGDFEILLCNARHVKQVPGRKTDVKDCEWLAQLLQFGLLTGSFVPARHQRELRDLTRSRVKILQERARVANRIQKILEDANVKLSSVASDALGKSGMAMIQAIVNGETDPNVVANLAKRQLRGKIPQLRRALEGRVTPHHRFMLGLELRRYQEQTVHVDALDSRILELTPREDEEDDCPLFPGKPESNRDNEAASGQHQAPSYNQAISLLVTVPGIGTRTAQSIVAEIGTNMAQFPSAGHLASWAGVCPGNNESAGKRKSGKTTKGNIWLRSALVMAARSMHRSKGYLTALYRRTAARRGSMRAQVAVAHSILTSIYVMLTRQVPYHDLGENYFDQRNSAKLTKRLVSRLERLGHDVSLTTTAA